MKLMTLSMQEGFSLADLQQFLENSSFEYKKTMLGLEINDEDVDAFTAAFCEKNGFKSTSQIEKEKEEIEKEKAVKRKAAASILITSGFNFDGYTITKYSGYISGDDAINVDRGTSFLGFGTKDPASDLMDTLTQIRRNALQELKEAAYDLGWNAVIGVDFDYITLDPETASITGRTTYLPYVFGVTANGNAVIIEKNNFSEA